MILTNEQEQALKIILNKYKNHEKYVTICGYAGVGKSTLVKFAIEALDVSPEKVAYATYTGKAAEVLRKKGNSNAMTLHKLLYDSIPRQGGGFIRIPKKTLDYDIVLIDEISMAPKSMLEMLLKHKVFCIFMGDNFQLPQIDKNEAHDFLQHPDIFLSTVMRQAEESEIIRLTMQIRNFQPLQINEGKEVKIMSKNDLSMNALLWADQVICATNAKRNKLNQDMRAALGYSGDPQEGERVICLQNYWDSVSTQGEALVNGTTGFLHSPRNDKIVVPKFCRINKMTLPIIEADFITEEGGVFPRVRMDRKLITEGESSLTWEEAYALGRLKKKIDIIPSQFDYGYAITAWKAQGSEWKKVLVLEENFPFIKVDHAKFLYTACTRASEKLVLVTK